ASGSDDLAVGLEGQGPGTVPAAEVRDHAAPGAKRRVQSAARVVARQGEKRAAEATGHDDLAVVLEGQGPGLVIATEVGEHPAPGAKRGVQAAVRVVARQGEVGAKGTGARASRHHDPSLGLE